jgi:hypothetical protein
MVRHLISHRVAWWVDSRKFGTSAYGPVAQGHTIFGVTLAGRVDQQLGGDGCAVAVVDDTWS